MASMFDYVREYVRENSEEVVTEHLERFRREYGITRPKRAYHEEDQQVDRMTRYDWDKGPMIYIGQQIVRAMQDAGYPSRIIFGYRTPEQQAQLYAKGRTAPGVKVTNAGPYQSAHNYYMAVDIVHDSKFWNVSESYWEALAAAVEIVADKFKVTLEHGHRWRFRDSAHIELKTWRLYQGRWGERPIAKNELVRAFDEVLPEVAKRRVQYLRRKESEYTTTDALWLAECK